MSIGWALASAGAAVVAVLAGAAHRRTLHTRRPPVVIRELCDGSIRPVVQRAPASPATAGVGVAGFGPAGLAAAGLGAAGLAAGGLAARLGLLERVALVAGALLILVRPALAAVVLAAALASILAERAQTRRAVASANRTAARSGVAAVAAALRSGLPPVTAWEAAAREGTEGGHARHGVVHGSLLGPVAAAARLGLDVPVALEEVARRPGADALRRVAVCCRVTEGAGSGLAGALERLVEGLREDDELAGIVAAELASARATGRLLAALPLVGVAGAAALGTPPRELLVESPIGRLCVLAAAVLEVGGLLWLRRLAASVR